MGFLKQLLGKVKKNKKADDPTKNPSYGPLIKELVEIDKSFHSADTSGFVNKEDLRHGRARDIGKELYYMGNKSIQLMKTAHNYILENCGEKAAENLSLSWNEIGIKYYNKKQGECWFNQQPEN